MCILYILVINCMFVFIKNEIWLMVLGKFLFGMVLFVFMLFKMVIVVVSVKDSFCIGVVFVFCK